MKKFWKKVKKSWKKFLKSKKVKALVKFLVVLKAVVDVVDVVLKLWDWLGPWVCSFLGTIGSWFHALNLEFYLDMQTA